MAEKEPMKVFELARELGIDLLTMVDRLRDLKIDVKNHMSPLSDSDADSARTAISGKAPGKTSGKSTSKTTSKSTDAKKASATKTPRTKAATSSSPAGLGGLSAAATRARKKAPAAESMPTPAADISATSTVIRRRVLADGATQTVTSMLDIRLEEVAEEVPAPTQTASAPETSAREESPVSEEYSEPETMTEERSADADLEATSKNEDPAPADAVPTPVAAEKTFTPTATTAATEEVPVASKARENAPSGATAKAPTPPPVIARRGTRIVKTEITPPKSQLRVEEYPQQQARGGMSQDSGGPRRVSISIDAKGNPVGGAGIRGPGGTGATAGALPGAGTRITLKRPLLPGVNNFLNIVKPTALPQRPMEKGAPDATAEDAAAKAKRIVDKDFRVIRVDKEGLDRMTEEDAKKRGEKPAESKGKPEDNNYADYRKKELVFFPKKKRIPMGKELKRTEITEMAAHKRVVEMHETINVTDLANQLQVKAMDVIRKLMSMGQMVSIHQSVDFDTASLVAAEYKFEVKSISFQENEFIDTNKDADELLIHRPPIVTIMGHVDHGKTTLLDSIRDANVAGGEAGGITQHIGAYSIEKNGKIVTFIDTPGHEAFTMMRARGANVTDIVILVVAADDGVMPQTREAVAHAKAAGVPIIVAVNKMDKPSANPERVKQELAELELLAEDWGGETMFMPVSALTKAGIPELIDGILLTAEVADLRANPNALASGTVLESRMEKGRGAVVSLLVKRGTLKVGSSVVAGTHIAKVRAMMDHLGRAVKEVTPGMAAEILGFESVPNAGEPFVSPESDSAARDIQSNRQDEARKKAALAPRASLAELFAKIQTGETKELRIILKADVYGSVEAVRDSLVKLSTEKVKVKVIHAAAGGITESDVMLANASDGVIIGFNVRPETKARQVADSEHIDIKCYSIIYELLDDVKKAMAGLLDKKKVEVFLGRAEVRQTFTVPKQGTIAGSSVIDGKIIRGANVRLLRDSRVIYEGKMTSLRRFKDDAKEVAQGYECGIGLESYNDVKIGDIIEAFRIDMVAQELH